MLNKHEEIINENILPRLQMLEENDIKFSNEMANIKTDLANVQKGQSELQVTVMKDGKETRDLLKPFADHYLNKVTAEDQAKKDIKLKRLDTKEKIVIAVLSTIFGTGGAAGAVLAILALTNGGQ